MAAEPICDCLCSKAQVTDRRETCHLRLDFLRAFVEIGFQRKQFPPHDFAGLPHLKLSAGAARHHHAFQIAKAPQLTLLVGQWPPPCFELRYDMRWFAARFVILLASPVGVVVLAALDSTIFFSLPFGIDAAVIILAARLQTLWWVAPILATVGSVAGAWLTFWMGVKAGEQGLTRYVSAKRLARVRSRIQRSGAVALAVLDLIPPPFPFTPFVLAAGALGVNASTFFVTLVVCRLLRFGLEAALAVVYGPHILSWLESELFHDIVLGCILVAVVLTLLSVIALVRTSGRPKGPRVPA